MFKETPEGSTHSYGDGCGEPAHNDPLATLIEIATEEFKAGCNAQNISDPPSDHEWILSFLTSKLTEAFNKGKEIR